MSGAGAGVGAGAAGVAGPAGGDGGVADGGGVQQGDGYNGGQSYGDAQTLAAQLAELADGQEQLRQFLLSSPRGFPGEAADGFEPGAGDGFDGLEAPDGLEAFGADGEQLGEFAGDVAPWATDGEGEVGPEQQLMGEIDGLVQDRLAQAVGPIQQQVDTALRNAQLEGQIRDLMNEFPALRDRDTMRELLDNSQMLIDAAGLPPQFALHPHIVRIVHMASLSADAAAAEQELVDNPPTTAVSEGNAGLGGGGQRESPGQSFMRTLNSGPPGKRALPFG